MTFHAGGDDNVREVGPSHPVQRQPRTRGTPGPPLEADVDRLFIPARAGNAARRGSGAGARSVHPRACGERENIFRPSYPASG